MSFYKHSKSHFYRPNRGVLVSVTEMPFCTDCKKWTPGTKHEYFINVLLGDISQLWIPPRFCYHLRNKVNRTFLLTGPDGKPYAIPLAKINKRLCFKDGWRTFAEENSLKEEELLLFRYDGEVSFKVDVFSISACQREGRQDKVNVGASCSNPIIICAKEEEEELADTSSESNGDSNSTEEEEVEEESTDTSHESKEDSSCTDMTGEETKGKKSGKSAWEQKYAMYFISRRRPVTREEKKKALRSATAMESPFPSFIVVMKPSCVYKGFYVNIPMDFIRDYHMQGETTRTIMVQNVELEGREWAVKLLCRGDRRGLGGTGWSGFVYDNNLEEGDVCVFELIHKKKNKEKLILIKVNIFRVVEETTPLKVIKTDGS